MSFVCVIVRRWCLLLCYEGVCSFIWCKLGRALAPACSTCLPYSGERWHVRSSEERVAGDPMLLKYFSCDDFILVIWYRINHACNRALQDSEEDYTGWSDYILQFQKIIVALKTTSCGHKQLLVILVFRVASLFHGIVTTATLRRPRTALLIIVNLMLPEST